MTIKWRIFLYVLVTCTIYGIGVHCAISTPVWRTVGTRSVENDVARRPVATRQVFNVDIENGLSRLLYSINGAQVLFLGADICVNLVSIETPSQPLLYDVRYGSKWCVCGVRQVAALSATSRTMCWNHNASSPTYHYVNSLFAIYACEVVPLWWKQLDFLRELTGLFILFEVTWLCRSNIRQCQTMSAIVVTWHCIQSKTAEKVVKEVWKE
jgi:hypothetical protein